MNWDKIFDPLNRVNTTLYAVTLGVLIASHDQFRGMMIRYNLLLIFVFGFHLYFFHRSLKEAREQCEKP